MQLKKNLDKLLAGKHFKRQEPRCVEPFKINMGVLKQVGNLDTPVSNKNELA